jgi:hypothetical protein
MRLSKEDQDRMLRGKLKFSRPGQFYPKELPGKKPEPPRS